MNSAEVKIIRLFPDVNLPYKASELAAAWDVEAYLPQGPLKIGALERVLVPTGLTFELPADYEIQVRPRSGLAYKHGITLPNSPGTIDADYRGELFICTINLSNTEFVVEHQMRMAQLVFARVYPIHFKEIQKEDQSQTIRGDRGFGHTGI